MNLTTNIFIALTVSLTMYSNASANEFMRAQKATGATATLTIELPKTVENYTSWSVRLYDSKPGFENYVSTLEMDVSASVATFKDLPLGKYAYRIFDQIGNMVYEPLSVSADTSKVGQARQYRTTVAEWDDAKMTLIAGKVTQEINAKHIAAPKSIPIALAKSNVQASDCCQ
ncbi:MAG: hypothetical protein EX271_01535 [Acidimicrobiales bacterium]|nr:hypothetical protein [Hyphomonadaceae bacterium]RZV44495.1 MAG: hypothetical protein EX271_01535 [Acidimicrobiales bacterium]